MLECKDNRKTDTLRPTDIPDLRLDLFSHYFPLCKQRRFVKTSNRIINVEILKFCSQAVIFHNGLTPN
jgi:hypothetical protein